MANLPRPFSPPPPPPSHHLLLPLLPVFHRPFLRLNPSLYCLISFFSNSLLLSHFPVLPSPSFPFLLFLSVFFSSSFLSQLTLSSFSLSFLSLPHSSLRPCPPPPMQPCFSNTLMALCNPSSFHFCPGQSSLSSPLMYFR